MKPLESLTESSKIGLFNWINPFDVNRGPWWWWCYFYTRNQGALKPLGIIRGGRTGVSVKKRARAHYVGQ